ncbi:hypothetical protein BKA00_004108 [Actinomadura coerulea]|uniref:Uncharacterized protein n=1 Tax=Actinomadura coerulea TaxID=46159 RepID=A0A7X0G0K2_9ACTN|nr:hypothetical protein [Actinomadura coerulea]MBB6397194.1 hypothetical protein [Actinomadura coerulea]GGQ46593.1 hypothetical protein GCM10010187_76010 [Actinomadura coerulea]
MRIPKRVNTVLDWVEEHLLALAVVVALVVVALVATLAPPAVGLPVAGFVLGAAAGGLVVHLRMSRRVARARSDIDNLLRENGALRHRNTVLASGVITRGAQETQALVSIPEDDLLDAPGDPETTVSLDELLDDPQTTNELPGEPPTTGGTRTPGDTGDPGDPLTTDELPGRDDAPTRAADPLDGDPLRTTVLPALPDDLLGGPDAPEDADTARTRRRSRKA